MRSSIVCGSIGLVCLGMLGRAEAGIQASASITNSAGSYYPYHYDLTLHNTGTTDVGTFWFAWDDSGLNFLPNYPYMIQAPAGWYGIQTDNYGVSDTNGYGIEWYGYGTSLAAGQSLPGFSFETYDSPDVIAGLSSVPPVNPGDNPFPVATSFVYQNYPAQQPGDTGFQFVAGGAVAVPEPASLGLLGAGLAGLLLRGRKRAAAGVNSY